MMVRGSLPGCDRRLRKSCASPPRRSTNSSRNATRRTFPARSSHFASCRTTSLPAPTREAPLALLKDRTGQSFTDAKLWAEWFVKSHPNLAGSLNHSDGFDPVAWKKREAAIPWGEGDSVKGRAAFTKATCAACHDGGGAIGPSLVGVSKRFSREDLLTAILQPSKDVSPRYRPTRILTTDGKSYVGMIVYEAVSGVILQTGPDAVVRIAGDQIESQKLLDASLMPTGLLDKLTDREVADLLGVSAIAELTGLPTSGPECSPIPHASHFC